VGTLALIGLGSNLGDRKANLDGALAALSGTPGIEVRAVSSFHETASVGGPPGQGAFLNAAAALEVGLSPPELLRALHAIEAGARRLREVCWGVRTLDLDLLLFGDQILDTPALLVPHPRMAVRRFVLAPLAEVAPKAVDPLTRRTMAELLANLDRRPRYLALANDGAADLFSRLVAELSAVGLNRGKQPSDWEDLEILDQRARELRADRWTTDLWGGRWVITDFWFDDLFPLARAGNGDRDRDAPTTTGRFYAARREVLEPTFVVLTARNTWHSASEPLADWARRSHPDAPVGCATPILRVRSVALETIVAEVLAACTATGPG
jgi:2-amino-4-hydroxy-6-hydroxymethyldihydropteridine diphosphokinase